MSDYLQSEKVCGLCFGTYVNLKQHLKGSHVVPNDEEFKLLVKYANARKGLTKCFACLFINTE